MPRCASWSAAATTTPPPGRRPAGSRPGRPPVRYRGAVVADDRPRVPQRRPARREHRVGHDRGHRPPCARGDGGPVTDPVTGNAWEPDDEDRAWCDVYGDWDPLTPGELRDLMEGFPAPWWVVGGQAVEAFTRVRRAHEDIDLVVFSEDVPALRAQFAGVFHLWSNYGGTFRIIDDAHPEPLDPLSQVWMRVNARSPWR